MNYKIKNDKITCIISEFGAELLSVKDKFGKEIMWEGNPDYWGEVSPLLFPTCGSLLNDEYEYKGKKYFLDGHGFAKRNIFDITEESDDSIKMVLKSSLDTKQLYPFDFTLTAEYKVIGDALHAVFTVKNDGNEIMPYMFGWHPGFALDEGEYEDYYLDFGKVGELSLHRLNGKFTNPKSEPFKLDGGIWQLNTEELYGYATIILQGANGNCALCRRGESRKYELSWSDNIPVFCVWKRNDDRARYICLEPWSDMPNDGISPENFETRKMRRLAPNESATYTYKINIVY